MPTSEDAVPEDDAWVRDDDEDEEEGVRLERASEEPLIEVAPEEEQEALAVAAHA